MLAEYLVCFNGRMVKTIGEVVGEQGDNWIVDFEHNGVEFRGAWPKAETTVV